MSLPAKAFRLPGPLLARAVIGCQRRNAGTAEVTFHVKGYKLHKLDKGPSETVTLNRDDALHYYRQMQMLRRMETAGSNLYKEKRIFGFCHLYSGQEAVAVGIKSVMEEDDAAITSYRCHAWTHLQGATVAEVLSELTGKMTGNVHGKGGSMHMYQRNFYGGNGIVGAQQPLGTGVAFAMKYLKKKNVCFTLYGDGAANQGQFYESINMAALWKIPCVYVCENNLFGMGTKAERSSASTEYYARGDFVPGIWADGMDVLAVREASKFAREYCISGKGPIVVELATYRYFGHSMSDPGTSYRTREEIQEVRKHSDPITGFKSRIITAGLVTEDELKQIDKEVKKVVDDAVNVAKTAPNMPVEGIYCDVYHNSGPTVVRGATIDNTHVQKFERSADFVKSVSGK